jgi:hypothetical protein
LKQSLFNTRAKVRTQNTKEKRLRSGKNEAFLFSRRRVGTILLSVGA